MEGGGGIRVAVVVRWALLMAVMYRHSYTLLIGVKRRLTVAAECIPLPNSWPSRRSTIVMHVLLGVFAKSNCFTQFGVMIMGASQS